MISVYAGLLPIVLLLWGCDPAEPLGPDDRCNFTYFRDADGDTFGDAATTKVACSVPPGYVEDNTDCDDADGNVSPGSAEACNSVDDDCDSLVDDADDAVDPSTAQEWHLDMDGDGYGSALATYACRAPEGIVDDDSDCDDTSALVNPAALEVCNGADDDCDGLVDDADASLDASCFLPPMSGSRHVVFGESEHSSDPPCDLWWAFEATPTAARCPTCDYGFDVVNTYLPAASSDNGTCGPYIGDFTTTISFDNYEWRVFRYEDSGWQFPDAGYTGYFGAQVSEAGGYYVLGEVDWPTYVEIGPYEATDAYGNTYLYHFMGRGYASARTEAYFEP
ncbi:hypothetical protein LBMAG42_37450 [Deltaproteobacteria bacterium]|nr:hypothetical protein LBMAG42_37450 [Deltaproteobacteria bacterium]